MTEGFTRASLQLSAPKAILQRKNQFYCLNASENFSYGKRKKNNGIFQASLFVEITFLHGWSR